MSHFFFKIARKRKVRMHRHNLQNIPKELLYNTLQYHLIIFDHKRLHIFTNELARVGEKIKITCFPKAARCTRSALHIKKRYAQEKYAHI